MNPDDTIAAIATPPGESGLAVIRISGPQALVVADRCFAPAGKTSLKPSAAPTHTIHYGKIIRHGSTVDEVLVAVLRAPRTFTREDTVEITCHGGILPAKMVLDTLLENGARLAEPGEFTRRAFLNGRLDLTQAEAVADLIHAQTELALLAANEQLAGKLSQRINHLRDEMVGTLAHVEAHLDFPEEDIAPDTMEQLLSRLEHGVAFMDQLLRTANEGQILRRGIRAAIIGRPNVGKSSLLNQLLGRDRAIVSHLPGTTRDTIEETANIRGLPVVFIDTAGLREARDEIEKEGVRRSRQTLQNAEFILHVFDVSEPLTPADERFLTEFAGKKRILVRNKMDLPRRLVFPPLAQSACSVNASSPAFPPSPAKTGSGATSRAPSSPSCGGEARGAGASANSSPGPTREIHGAPPGRTGGVRSTGEGEPTGQNFAARTVDVSCLTGEGIEQLKDAIKELVWSGEIKAEMLQVMINSRHQEALNRARQATLRTIEALRAGQTLELAAMDLRIAVNAVGEIVGKTTTEDLLDMIFSQFCIGK